MTDQGARVVGRYALYGAIAAGGMATVHLGRLLGPAGFSRTVAIKRLHAQFATDPEFVSMFLDEARLAARIRHPNVVPTLDVVATAGELFLVMDYVPGESIARLWRTLRERKQTLPLPIVSHAMTGVLHGLHAAHEAKDERGLPLGIVHRDVSPQNVLIGTDGVPRVLDFGVAKAAGRIQTTREGQLKGKLAYMPPEQLRGAAVSRQTDIYAVGVMLWELVTGERLFVGDNEGVVVAKILEGHVEPPSAVLKRTRRESVPEEALATIEQLDATILRALSTQAEARFANAREMALELERKCPPTTSFKCGEWVEDIARDVLSSRAALVAEVESSASMTIEGHDSVLSVLDASSSVRATALRSAEITPALVTPTTGPHLPTASRMLAPPIEGAPRPSSSIPASAGSFAEPRQRGELGGRAAIVIAVIAVLLGASMLAGALAYRRTKQDEASDPGAAEPPALPAVVTSSRAVEPTTSAPTATPPTTTSAASAATAGDAGSAAIGSGPGSTATATRGATGSSPKVVKSGAGTKVGGKSAAETDDCTTPYYYDSAQVKHYKPRCLGDK